VLAAVVHLLFQSIVFYVAILFSMLFPFSNELQNTITDSGNSKAENGPDDTVHDGSSR